MHTVQAVKAMFFGAIGFLLALAMFSRIVQMPEMPQLIKDGSSALANLFRGAFA